MTKRSEVYAAIDGERDYQNAKWCKNKSDSQAGHNPHSVAEWLTYMRYYCEEGIKLETMSFEDGKALDFARKVAALGVVCMEQHGAPHRDGY